MIDHLLERRARNRNEQMRWENRRCGPHFVRSFFVVVLFHALSNTNKRKHFGHGDNVTNFRWKKQQRQMSIRMKKVTALMLNDYQHLDMHSK